MRPLSPKKRRQKYAETRDDVRMIDDPEAWVVDGIFPLRSWVGLADDEFTRLGVLIADGSSLMPSGESRYTVYETCMHQADFENCPRHRYASAREIVDAGWEVD